MKNILFFVDCSDEIGFGHIKRCSAIAIYLKKTFNVIVILRDEHYYNYSDIKYETIKDFESLIIKDFLVKNNLNIKETILFFDTYLLSEDKVNNIENNFEKTIFIDDYKRIYYQSSLVIDWSPGAENLFNNRSDRSTYLLGFDYLCLRKEFLCKREERCLNPVLDNKTITIGTIFGGTDVKNLTPTVSNIVEENFSGINIFSFATSSYPCLNICNNLYVDLPTKELVDKLYCCDFVITSGGQTVNELAFLGIKSAVICINDEQVHDICMMEKLGLTQFICKWDDEHLENKILTILTGDSFIYKFNNFDKVYYPRVINEIIKYIGI